MGTTLNLSRATLGGTVSRIRGNVSVVLAVSKADAGAATAGEFVLSLLRGGKAAASFPLQHGSNAVSFDVPVGPSYGVSADASLEVQCNDHTNVQSAWADLHATQLDCLVEDTGAVVLSPISMTPIEVMGSSRGGTGGGWIQKAGDLLMVDAIEVTGFFAEDAIALVGQTELYGPAWLAPETHVALAAPVAIPGDESGWGWSGGSCPVPGLPEGGAYLCEVALDGGAPVLALLFNEAGF